MTLVEVFDYLMWKKLLKLRFGVFITIFFIIKRINAKQSFYFNSSLFIYLLMGQ